MINLEPPYCTTYAQRNMIQLSQKELFPKLTLLSTRDVEFESDISSCL